MSVKTGIQWTDHTFNPWWGCIRVSPGCEHCYAETFAKRVGFDVWGPAKTTGRREFGDKHWAEPVKWNREAEREGSRKRVFCASMADVFEDHPVANATRPRLFDLIRATPSLDWQLLTKRPENIAAMLPPDWGNGYANVWLGTTIESPEYVHRFDQLRSNRAAVYFLSLEPMIADVSVAIYDKFAGLPPDEVWWAIVGGESGPKARVFELDWARGVIDACGEFGVYVFVKQLGSRPRGIADHISHRGDSATKPSGFYRFLNDAHGGDWSEWPEDLRVREFPEAVTV